MLQSHSETCGQVKACLGRLEQACENGEDVAAVAHQLSKVTLRMCREAGQLSQVLHESPVRRIFSTDRLNVTEQQYLFAHAYLLCVYEDDEVVAFMHPDETPPPPPRHEGNTTFVPVHVALSPEEVDVAHLRPEQVEFFTKYRPDILPRLGLLKRDRREQPAAEAAASPQGRE
jgi:hypothetical protein